MVSCFACLIRAMLAENELRSTSKLRGFAAFCCCLFLCVFSPWLKKEKGLSCMIFVSLETGLHDLWPVGKFSFK